MILQQFSKSLILAKYCFKASRLLTWFNSKLRHLPQNNVFSNFCVNMTDSKKMKCEPLKIGTHNGRFHCDEILACFMLQQLEKYKNAVIIRSRDQDILDTCNIIVDVGGVFDENTNKFDHHQRSFHETFSDLRPKLGASNNIRLSSAGLIYTYFGEKVIANMLKEHKNITLSADSLQLIYKKVYENFVREIDAIDNGVQICEGEPRYQIQTHLSARVDKFNPSWDFEGPVDENALFEKAKELVGTEFTEAVIFSAVSWLPARNIVKNAIECSKKLYESGEILELSRPCPWKEHLFELEEIFNIVGLPKYVIFSDEDDWRVICVPRLPNSFICRKFLHKDWRGLRDKNLQQLSGIEDAKFCHSNGFIAGAASREGVLQLAIQSLLGDYTD